MTQWCRACQLQHDHSCYSRANMPFIKDRDEQVRLYTTMFPWPCKSRLDSIYAPRLHVHAYKACLLHRFKAITIMAMIADEVTQSLDFAKTTILSCWFKLTKTTSKSTWKPT